MRILMVVHSLRRGGAERVILEVGVGLRARGHQVSIATLVALDEYPEPAYASLPRHPLLRFEHYRWPRCLPGLAAALGQCMDEVQPDIIQIHSWTCTLVCAWARAATPAVEVVHGSDFAERRSLIRKIGLRWIDRLVYRRLRPRIVVVAPGLRPALAKHLGCQAGEIRCIVNGVDLDRFPFRARVPSGMPILLMIGTLSHLKRQDLAIRALPRLLEQAPGARLVILGDGPTRQELASLIARLHLGDRVELVGQQNDVAGYLEKAHVLWHLSEREGLPVVVLEAMATGLPVIGHDVPGVRDVVANGKTGYLIPFGDTDALIERTVRLLTDSRLNQTMGQAARARVEQEFDRERMIHEHEALLQSVAHRAGKMDAGRL
ncbi:MAG: glycosyltransferase family 4 protein [Planctomycetes bacterium]|nr:glycosyltransferase family 4 protein [Planctomycetota bacterium]